MVDDDVEREGKVGREKKMVDQYINRSGCEECGRMACDDVE